MKPLTVPPQKNQSLLQAAPLAWVFFMFTASLSLLWLGLSLVPITLNQKQKNSAQSLAKVRSAISSFLDEQGTVPLDLTELWAFAQAKGRRISRFDGFGNRLDYIRLSDSHYIIRAFGRFANGGPEAASSLQVASRVSDPPSVTAQYQYPTQLVPSMFPSPLALGTSSPDGVKHAQIYVDSSSGQKRLVVRATRNSDFSPVVSKHDSVEEFFWMPSGTEVVYSSTGSARYSDGVFLWNPSKDTVVDLTRKLDLVGSPVEESKLYLISLAGVSASGREIGFFLSNRYDGVAISPRDFFSSRNYFSLKVSDRMTQFLPGEIIRDEKLFSQVLKAPFEIFASVSSGQTRDALFKEWVALRFEGILKNQLERWQEFVLKRAHTPVFAYGLWFLGSIYADVAVVLSRAEKESGAQVRAYSLELFQALSDYDLAPSYLRAFSQYALGALRDGWQLDYQLSKFELEKSEIKNNFGWRYP